MLFYKSVFCSTFFSEHFFHKTPTLCFRAHMFRLPWVRVIHFIFYLQKELHYVNSVQIWSFCWSVFSRIQSKYGEIQPSKKPCFWTLLKQSWNVAEKLLSVKKLQLLECYIWTSKLSISFQEIHSNKNFSHCRCFSGSF